MSDFHVRSDSVDVEQIMRADPPPDPREARRRLHRRADQGAGERPLEKFLDPKNLRSDLLEQFRRSRPAEDSSLPPMATYEFEDSTLYDTHRGLLRTIRRLLNPLLKLFFNPNQLVNVLHQQAELNRHFVQTTRQARVDRAAWNSLYYEVLHNLVLETTRARYRDQEPEDAGRSRCRAGWTSTSGGCGRSRASCSIAPKRWLPRERRPEAPSQAAGGSEPAGVPGAGAGAGPADGGPGAEGRKRRRRRRRTARAGHGPGPGRFYGRGRR